jgi:hypothetical protein
MEQQNRISGGNVDKMLLCLNTADFFLNGAKSENEAAAHAADMGDECEAERHHAASVALRNRAQKEMARIRGMYGKFRLDLN